MAQKVKISVRKVLQALLTFVVASTCIIAIISASKVERSKNLEGVEVHIKSEKLYHFVEEKQILDEAIHSRNVDIMNIPVGKLDIQSMEQVLKSDPWVADAQLYIDNNRVLHILITQRIPVARIFEKSGNSYYIDNTLSEMPLSDNFKYYTSVVTNAPVLGNDSLSTRIKGQIVSMVQFIRADTFWNAQISQIIIDSDYSFQLEPVLGQQRIIFGDTARMAEKFGNVYTFYKKVLNRIGWDKYNKLDVRFKGQVVASPSLPYTGPIDKAVNEMNWISSIEQTEARTDSIKASKLNKNAGEKAAKAPEPTKKENKPAAKDKDKKDKHTDAKAPVKTDKKDTKKDNKDTAPKKAPDKKETKPPVKKVEPAKKPEPTNKEKSNNKNTDKKPARAIYQDDKEN